MKEEEEDSDLSLLSLVFIFGNWSCSLGVSLLSWILELYLVNIY